MNESQGHKTPLNADNFLKHHPSSAQPVQAVAVSGIGSGSKAGAGGVPFGRQFAPLMERSFKNFYRLPSNQINKLVSAVMVPAFLGIMYYQLGNEVPEIFDQQYILNLISLLFMGTYFIFSMNVYDTSLHCTFLVS
jgi:hypothetical protein